MSVASAPAPLDTRHLARALRSGIHRVIREQETLNRINVFPVADGDTGTNLCVSLGAALDTLARPGSERLGAFLARLADVLLDSARGNSGAIMAQFFQGMSDATVDLPEFSAESLARAVETGSRYAHDALSNPREGTILSVMAAFSASLGQQPPAIRVGDAIGAATEAARTALAMTENQLDVLRKAGVVDAGAKGFVVLVEGMAEYLINGREDEVPDLTGIVAPEETITMAGTLCAPKAA